MTTSPWSGEVYAVYGHTAIFVEDKINNIDVVFNYGIFDTSQPNFILNFIRGKTDYILGISSYEEFIAEYRERGVEVIKQELNLSQKEKQNIWEALYVNSYPENRTYRYNYFYDNCVTRPRDIIEEYVKGEIEYPKDTKTQTYRDLVHECVDAYPWLKFGIDLVIGRDADKPLSIRQKMFLPSYLMNYLDNTRIKLNSNELEPIVLDREVVVNKKENKLATNIWNFLTPFKVAIVLLFFSFIASYLQYSQKKYLISIKIYDTLLYGCIGLGGMVIFFLMFFSEHPATGANWNFIWMNIFTLLVTLMFWLKHLQKVIILYHFINFVFLTIFLMFWWLIPQKLPLASIPLSLSLLTRSAFIWFMKERE